MEMPESPAEHSPVDDVAVDVVAVGAHPDDVEMCCGGTLAKLVRQGYRVAIVDLTNGEPTPNCPDPQVRLAEAERAARCLGVHHRWTLELDNRRLFDSFQARVALAKQLRRLRPLVVLGWGARTPLASPDHWQAMQITDAAVFYARLTKWEATFDHLPVHTVQAQLYFWSSLAGEPPSDAAGVFTVDIGDTLDQKLASIQCYETQFPESKQPIIQAMEIGDRHVGGLSGFVAGERFVCTRPLGVHDLVRAVLPGAPAAGMDTQSSLPP
jgi:LmbE family N-acetylglucosaminyl deacetylase